MSDILRYLTPSVHVSSSSTSWHYGELQGRPSILHFRYKQWPKIMLNLLWNIFKFEIKLMTFSNSVAFPFKHLQQVKCWKQCHDHRRWQVTKVMSHWRLSLVYFRKMRIQYGFAYIQARSIISMTMRMFHVYHEFYNCIAYIAKEVHLDLFFSDKYTNYILK